MLLSSLSEYQGNTDSIKDELVGYDPKWRKDFDSKGKKKLTQELRLQTICGLR